MLPAASIGVVTTVVPIVGADAIEMLTISIGDAHRQAVTKRGELHVGDLCAWIEPGARIKNLSRKISLKNLPKSRVRQRWICGQLSEGLALPLHHLEILLPLGALQHGDDISAMISARKGMPARPPRPPHPKYEWINGVEAKLASLPPPSQNPTMFGEILPLDVIEVILQSCSLSIAGRLGLTKRDAMSEIMSRAAGEMHITYSIRDAGFFRFYLASKGQFPCDIRKKRHRRPYPGRVVLRLPTLDTYSVEDFPATAIKAWRPACVHRLVIGKLYCTYFADSMATPFFSAIVAELTNITRVDIQPAYYTPYGALSTLLNLPHLREFIYNLKQFDPKLHLTQSQHTVARQKFFDALCDRHQLEHLEFSPISAGISKLTRLSFLSTLAINPPFPGPLWFSFAWISPLANSLRHLELLPKSAEKDERDIWSCHSMEHLTSLTGLKVLSIPHLWKRTPEIIQAISTLGRLVPLDLRFNPPLD